MTELSALLSGRLNFRAETWGTWDAPRTRGESEMSTYAQNIICRCDENHVASGSKVSAPGGTNYSVQCYCCPFFR